MRTAGRVAVVLFIAVTALVFNAADILDPWHPYGIFPYTTDTAGVITSVQPSATARGLRPGDRVDVSKMTMRDRVYLSSAAIALPGSRLVLPLVSGKRVTVIAQARPRTLAENTTDLICVPVSVIYTLLAALLVLLRPMPSTWAFLLFSAGFLYNGSQAQQYFSAAAVAFYDVLTSALLAISPFAFFSFALRFPEAVPAGRAALGERVLLFGAAPSIALWAVFNFVGIVFGVPVPQWQTSICEVLIAAFYLPGIAILLARYGSSSDEDRVRLRWVVGAFAIAFVPVVVSDTAQFVLGYISSVVAANLSQAWMIVAPVALAYTVLRHRLFDIRFVVSRALLYAFLTTLTVGVLALGDWGLGKWLEASRFALVAEVALAVVIGFSLTSLHGRIERFLNGVIFRAQGLALAAVRRFTHEIDLIAEPQELIAQTYETLRGRIECDYVAIFTADGDGFGRAVSSSGELPERFAASDLAVLRLRRWNEAFECDEPAHPLRGALLVPMPARAQLAGFIVCGPKPDRTHYLPDEVATLEALAHRAGAGYAWLTMRPLTA